MANHLFMPEADTPDAKVKRIGIVAFDGVELLDLTGPLDMFGMSALDLLKAGVVTETPYPIEVLARQPGLITSSSSLGLHAGSAYGQLRDELDSLLMPGAPRILAPYWPIRA